MGMPWGTSLELATGFRLDQRWLQAQSRGFPGLRGEFRRREGCGFVSPPFGEIDSAPCPQDTIAVFVGI